MGTREVTGTCKFCGQTRLISHTEDEWLAAVRRTNAEPQVIADEEATLECTCKAGRDYREIVDAIKICEENIEEMLREPYPEAADVLQLAKNYIYGGKPIKAVTISLADHSTVKMSYGKSGIKVEHKKTMHTELVTGL